MSHTAFLYRKNAGACPGAAAPAAKGREKFSSGKKSRNPLKSLDSDERIQGNPRKSNRHNRGVSRQNSRDPRNPKRSTPPILQSPPTSGARRRLDNVLPNRLASSIVFQKLATGPTCASHGRTSLAQRRRSRLCCRPITGASWDRGFRSARSP
jgi:hypothetical protein